ncbi:hypothetical protein A176_000189 [Myxococcus hansupus]|uniref:Lipoprotein n=1 Tax=Pseudomyxococcus hansupus TaxID=1297742 RepID=A0A0H4X5Y1_9BACT|nr:hypothetical protein [Myxococcus hansupus]AKQ63277.1 hypothetical protein A176_000189 [Myxococcus hansupus]
MRLLRQYNNTLWAAVFAFTLPFAQAQAQECVEFKGLNHCGIGNAQVSVSDEGLKVVSDDASGKGGVLIYTGLATSWTAGFFSESDADENRMLFSSVSEGSVTSTASVETRGKERTYAGSFTGAGESTTYSVLVYQRGRLQAAVGGIRNGTIGGQEPLEPGPIQPYCRPQYQTQQMCEYDCADRGYGSCNYCRNPCQGTFRTLPDAVCQWRFDVAYGRVMLMDGREVEGDEIVLTEEVRGPTSYPYLGFDEIHVQSTARTLRMVSESVIPAASK